MTDWTDETLRPLDELARLAFPENSGVTADTLKRRARKSQLRVYKPGKAFLSTLADVWTMVQTTQLGQKPPPVGKKGPPNALGLTELELSNMALEHALKELRNKAAEQEREDEWERKYEARKAARAEARPPRTSKKQ